MENKSKGDLSLHQFLDMINNMTPFLEHLDSPLKERLAQEVQAAEVRANKLLQFPDTYKQAIIDYLKSNPPFEWNRNQQSSPELMRRDQKQHDDLTIYAYLIEDDSLLLEWGVEYPLGPKGPGLANTSQDYLNLLENAIATAKVEEQKQYYRTLIDHLKTAIASAAQQNPKQKTLLGRFQNTN